MAHIVELREMSDEQLEDRIENAREELFNLRFQKASARLQDTSRIPEVRREVAQMKEVLHKRRLAVDAALEEPQIAAALDGQNWEGRARYVYGESAWIVEFLDNVGDLIASATVDLNRKRPRSQKEHERKGAPQLVESFEVTG
jgi:large subunit ribosomal protein L29